MKRILTYNNNIISAGGSILNIDYSLKNGLRYLLEFDDTIVNYTITDSAGNYNFTYQNNYYGGTGGGLGVDGKINKCVKFGDSDTYPEYFMTDIRSTGLNNQYNFNKTFTFWVRQWGNNYNYHLYSNYYDEGSVVYRNLSLDWVKLTTQNRLCIIYNSITPGASYAKVFDPNLNNDEWYFVCFRFNGRSDMLDVFINDSLFTDASEGTTNFDTQFNESGISFGESQCYIDQSGFWDRSLSDYEIKQIYNNGNGLPYSQW